MCPVIDADDSGVREFGPFRLDRAERLLLRGDRPVALTPKAFDLLVYLVDRPGRLVDKQTLMSALWPDVIVEEGNLASTVSALRKALGDAGDEPRTIATVPTRGYRFVLPVTRPDASRPPAPPLEPALPAAAPGGRSRPARAVHLAATVVLVAATTAGATWFVAPRWHRDGSPVVHVQVGIAPAEGIVGPDLHGDRLSNRNLPTRTAIALSPDGRDLVFAGVRGDQQHLWRRRLGRDEATPIAGTTQAAAPFFSPDGRSIGFWSRGALWRVALEGGVPARICDARHSFGASWGSDGTIVFADERGGGLRRVSAEGGAPQPLTTVDASRGEGSHHLPHLLPDARAVVFTITAVPGAPHVTTDVAVQSLDTGERRILLPGAADARYVAPGHLVYALGETLMVVPFDPATLALTGESTVLRDGVMRHRSTAASQFAVSAASALVWLPAVTSPDPTLARTLVWVDQRGRATPIPAPADAYYQPRLSPDGRYVALLTRESVAAIWVYDTQSAVRSRVPFDGFATAPIWTPDGRRLVFGGARAGNVNLFSVPADGSGPEQRLTTNAAAQYPVSWTPDGEVLVFLQCTSQCDVWALSGSGSSAKAWPVIESPADEQYATLSPDGKWLAYMSNESGRIEVYVRSFRDGGPRYQISSEGGAFPRWSLDGRRLYYCETPDNGPLPMSLPLPPRQGHTYLVSDVSTRSGFSASTPRVVFHDADTRYTLWAPTSGYDVAPDGRFLMVEVSRLPEALPPPRADVRLVLNWPEWLRTRMQDP